MVATTTMVNLSLRRYHVTKQNICFADLVKINKRLKLNLDNTVLLFVYDELRDDVNMGARRIKAKLLGKLYAPNKTRE